MVYHVSRLFLSHLVGEEVAEGRADRCDGGELSDLVPARRDRGRENVRGELSLQGHGEVVREDAPRPLHPRVVRRSGSRVAGRRTNVTAAATSPIAITTAPNASTPRRSQSMAAITVSSTSDAASHFPRLVVRSSEQVGYHPRTSQYCYQWYAIYWQAL